MWLADGQERLATYATTLAQVSTVQDVLAAPPPGRELHLADRLARLRLEEPLGDHFAQLTGGRRAKSTLESYVAIVAHKFFAAARERLPVAPGPELHQEDGL